MISSKILTFLKILSLVFLIGFTGFAISIPISASFLSIKPPSINEIKIALINNTLIANASYSIINNGFYDLQDLTINLALYTLNHILITSSQIGFPKEKITVRAHSTYKGNISIKFNLDELSELDIINRIKKDKAVYIKLSASGRYGLGMFSFNTLYSGKISFSLPIENVKLSFSETSSINIINITNEENFVIIRLNAILDFNATIKLNQTSISGYALYNNTKIFFFNSSAEQVLPGRNIIPLDLYIPKDQIEKLFFNDLSLRIIYKLQSKDFQISDSFNYKWIKPFHISLSDFQIDTIDPNSILLKTYLYIDNYLNYNFNLSTKLKVYDSNNKLINEKNINYIINSLSTNEIYLEILLNNVYHGMVIRCEIYIINPFKIDLPVIIKYFVLP